MFRMPEKITYALPELIGNTELFVGRKKEFDFFLGEWYDRLIGNIARSQAIVARRKKGKTAFLQRLFNILWSCPDTGVIPFYFSVREMKTTLAEFSKSFFATFTNHYLSFLEKNVEYLQNPYSFELLDRLIEKVPELSRHYESIKRYKAENEWGLMWEVASRAPSEIAVTQKIKIVQILEEFQNLNEYVFDYRGQKIDSLSGTYLDLAEKREAPLIISGSEVHGLLEIVRKLTARFEENVLENLPEEEAKEAIWKYAEIYRTKIDNAGVDKLWNLTRGDPLYIYALFSSYHNAKKRLRSRGQRHRSVHARDQERTDFQNLGRIPRRSFLGSERKGCETDYAVPVSGGQRTHSSANNQRPQARYNRFRTENEAAKVNQSGSNLIWEHRI